MWPFKKKDTFKLVKTYALDITITNGSGDKWEAKQYLYLFEDESGSRKYEQKCSDKSCGDDLRGIEHFQHIVYPWIHGVNHPDIPSYWDIVKVNNNKYVKEMYKRLLRK